MRERFDSNRTRRLSAMLCGLVLLVAVLPGNAWAKRVAVLEFVGDGNIDDGDLSLLSQKVRSLALRSLDPSEWEVITKENMLVLMESNAADLSGCVGECEVETGRLIGADLV